MIVLGLAGRPGSGQDFAAHYLMSQYGFATFVYPPWFRGAGAGAPWVTLNLTALAIARALAMPGIAGEVPDAESASWVRTAGGRLWFLHAPGQPPSASGIIPSGDDRGLLHDGDRAELASRIDRLLEEIAAEVRDAPGI